MKASNEKRLSKAITNTAKRQRSRWKVSEASKGKVRSHDKV